MSFGSSARPPVFRLDMPLSQPFQTPVKSAVQNSSAFAGTREKINFDFSSGPENPSSPENADNEDTPEVAKRPLNENVTVFRGSSSPKKDSFPKLFDLGIGGRFSPPGRRELSKHKRDAGGFMRRGHKRKRREAERDNGLTRRRGYSSDSEDRSRPSSSDSPRKASASRAEAPKEIGMVPAILTFIHDHPDLPNIFMNYVQFLWNVFVVLACIYMVYVCFATINSDVEKSVKDAQFGVMQEIALCKQQWEENKCDRATRVPAMEQFCENWQACIDQDPGLVGRAKVGAGMFAEILNNFVEPLSYKLLVPSPAPPAWPRALLTIPPPGLRRRRYCHAVYGAELLL
jgi:hypothetical protein